MRLGRYETPILWVYSVALVASMLLFAAVGFWLYVVFAALSIPAILGTAWSWVKGKRPDTDSWIMLVAVLIFLSVGGYVYATRGTDWPQESSSAQEEATQAEARRPSSLA